MEKIIVNIKKIIEKIHMNKQNIKNFGIDFFFLTLACALGAFAVTAIMIPNGLTSGGLTGLVRIVQNFVPVNISILFYGGSILIVLFVFITSGFKEVRKLLLMSLLYPTIIFFFERLDFGLLEEQDIILAAIFFGVFIGASSGLIFWRGYTFCGTDAIAKVIKKKWMPTASISQILLVLDAVIIISAAFIFGRNIALYALVTQVILTKTIDFVLFGFETKIVQLKIITEKPDEITKYIMNDIGRGVSESIVIGGYTKLERRQLITLCSPRESLLIKRFIAQVDQMAFVAVVHVTAVWGRGEGFGDITDTDAN